MKVCDCCREERPDDIRLVVLKQRAKEKTTGKKERECITIPMELCDLCLTRVMVNLGAFIKSGEAFIENWRPRPC